MKTYKEEKVIYQTGEGKKDEAYMITSPIELMFLDELRKQTEIVSLKNNNYKFDIKPQWIVEKNNKKYRVDIDLEVIYVNIKDDRYDFYKYYFIECDGYDYHYRNKKQVTNDRKRERALMNDCHRFLRFTGTEIYKDVKGCVKELLDIVQKDVGVYV